MKKVLFYIHNGWVFGKIHNELIKALHPEFYCDILCWSQPYTRYEFDYIKQKYDLFLSTPEACFNLHCNYGVPLEKTIAVVHSNWDIYNPLKNPANRDYFSQFGAYGGIAPILQHISLAYGIDRLFDFVPVGVFTENYPKPEIDQIRKIGYFSKYSRTDQGHDLKRGHIVEKIAEAANVELKKVEGIHFLGAEMLYSGIDLVICPSLTEGNPYPVLEAFACGIPVFSTPVGVAQHHIGALGGGKIFPFAEKKFIEGCVEELQYLNKDAEALSRLCKQSRAIGEEINWINVKNSWINLINKANI